MKDLKVQKYTLHNIRIYIKCFFFCENRSMSEVKSLLIKSVGVKCDTPYSLVLVYCKTYAGASFQHLLGVGSELTPASVHYIVPFLKIPFST